MGSKGRGFKVGDICLLKEDYDEDNASAEFNIECEIVGFALPQVNLSEGVSAKLR